LKGLRSHPGRVRKPIDGRKDDRLPEAAEIQENGISQAKDRARKERGNRRARGRSRGRSHRNRRAQRRSLQEESLAGHLSPISLEEVSGARLVETPAASPHGNEPFLKLRGNVSGAIDVFEDNRIRNAVPLKDLTVLIHPLCPIPRQERPIESPRFREL